MWTDRHRRMDEQTNRQMNSVDISIRLSDSAFNQDMASLRDYIAYGRTYVHPKLGEEAGQSLTEAYVGQCSSHCIDIKTR